MRTTQAILQIIAKGMRNLSPHTKGIMVTGLGVLIVSPDGLLVRSIHTDLYNMIFWRASFLSVGMVIVIAILFRSQVWSRVMAIGKAGLVMAGMQTIGMIAFMYALTNTSVANTLLILSTTPLFAALMSWILMREPLPLRTWLAITLVAFGMLIISTGKGDADTSLSGDMAAAIGAFILGCSFTITRKYVNRSMLPAFSVGAALTALCMLPLASPLSASNTDMILLCVMGLLMLPIGLTFMYFGPRYIPAAEVGLLLLLESLLGPFWVWMALGEHPGARTFIGGAVILLALAIHLLWAMRVRRAGATLVL